MRHDVEELDGSRRFGLATGRRLVDLPKWTTRRARRSSGRTVWSSREGAGAGGSCLAGAWGRHGRSGMASIFIGRFHGWLIMDQTRHDMTINVHSMTAWRTFQGLSASLVQVLKCSSAHLAPGVPRLDLRPRRSGPCSSTVPGTPYMYLGSGVSQCRCCLHQPTI